MLSSEILGRLQQTVDDMSLPEWEHMITNVEGRIPDFDSLYLFTLNTKDKFFHDLLGLQHGAKWWKMYRRVLSKLKQFSSVYCVIPEISIKGRLHCHGWFYLTDSIKYHKSFLPTAKRAGMVCINQAKSLNGLNYCKKDLAKTYNILGKDFFIVCNDSDKIIKRTLKRIIDKAFSKRKVKPNALLRSMMAQSCDEDAYEYIDDGT